MSDLAYIDQNLRSQNSWTRRRWKWWKINFVGADANGKHDG